MRNVKIEEKRKTNFEIIGIHTERFRTLMIVLSSILTAFGLLLCIYWEFDENSAGDAFDYAYLYTEIAFTVLSALLVVLLVLNKFGKVRTFSVSLYIHIYVALVVAWGTAMCILDLTMGLSPILYLLIVTAVSGLFVVEPIFFGLLCFLSYNIIMAFAFVNVYAFFESVFRYENFINLFLFVVFNILAAFRHFEVTAKEYRAMKKLEEMSYIDGLTGLYNERSYVDETEKIENRIKAGAMEGFAVVLMDVNNLKNTNDAFGHRYGCHLVVRCGNELPKVFPTSKLFHIGGDEFLAIVTGEDYVALQERIAAFDETMSYSIINYDSVDLVFSVARGYSVYEPGDDYKAVMQRADKAMYENKSFIKKKHNIGGR